MGVRKGWRDGEIRQQLDVPTTPSSPGSPHQASHRAYSSPPTFSSSAPMLGCPLRTSLPAPLRGWQKGLGILLEMKGEKRTPAQKIPKNAGGVRWFPGLNFIPLSAYTHTTTWLLDSPGRSWPRTHPLQLWSNPSSGPASTSDQVRGYRPGPGAGPRGGKGSVGPRCSLSSPCTSTHLPALPGETFPALKTLVFTTAFCSHSTRTPPCSLLAGVLAGPPDSAQTLAPGASFPLELGAPKGETPEISPCS